MYTTEHQRIGDRPLHERPREKMLRLGPEMLSDLELLAILLGSGTKEFPVDALAASLLEALDSGRDKGSLKGGNGGPLDLKGLLAVKGLGPARVTAIAAALEFGRRRAGMQKRRISFPGDVFPFVRHYADRPQEHFLCVALNGAHEVLSVRVVSIGLVNRTIVHPREVFADPLQERATAVIVAHNHPSGNLEPSKEDIDITERLRQAGALLGISLLDHLVFSSDGYFSFLEGGKLNRDGSS